MAKLACTGTAAGVVSVTTNCSSAVPLLPSVTLGLLTVTTGTSSLMMWMVYGPGSSCAPLLMLKRLRVKVSSASTLVSPTICRVRGWLCVWPEKMTKSPEAAR